MKVVATVFFSLSCLVSAQAQTQRLVVPDGAPLRIVVSNKVRYKKGQAVHGKTVDPVFAFDREVLPSGTEVLGHVSGFKNAPRLIRIRALMGGNFTPIREPLLAFDSLTMKDGKTIPINPEVSVGADTIVRFSNSAQQQNKGRVASATEMARQQIEAKKRAVLDTIKGPGKMDRVKDALWSTAPWHPQYLPAGSRFNAKLTSPMEFGEVTIPPGAMADLGSQPPADSVVAARLITALDSKTATHGMKVEAVLTRPLLSPEGHILFPEGSRLTGDVVQTEPARRWHRNGKLAFMFTQMAPPPGLIAQAESPQKQEVEGRLDGVEVNGKDGVVQLDEEGGASTTSSKKRFIAPALSMMLAMHGADNDPVRVNGVKTGATQHNYGGHLLSGVVGFGMLGGAIGRFMGPAGSALGFYGAGRSIYTNIVARGQEVTFPMNTPIEIRFGTPPNAGQSSNK